MEAAAGPGKGGWMMRALELAALADYETSPNPMVGAVVLNDGAVVGEGYHRRAGEAHAEVVALEQAGERARGAQLWVTLEPCCTTGRTGPCVERILESGVSAVHVAMADPNPSVDGRGIAALRSAGVAVTVGENEAEAAHLIEAYAVWVRTGIPFVTVKVAMSLDGKVATAGGQSQWITSEEARADGHRLRHSHDAIMVGSGTVLRDDPTLTARYGFERGRQPLRVVLDGRLRTPAHAKLFQERSLPVLVATAAPADPVLRKSLEAAGAEVLEFEARGGRPALRSVLRNLGRRDVISVLVEGGPTLLSSLQEERVGNRVVSFIAPAILGGRGAPSPFGGEGVVGLDDAWRLRWTGAVSVGPDLRLTAEV